MTKHSNKKFTNDFFFSQVSKVEEEPWYVTRVSKMYPRKYRKLISRMYKRNKTIFLEMDNEKIHEAIFSKLKLPNLLELLTLPHVGTLATNYLNKRVKPHASTPSTC